MMQLDRRDMNDLAAAEIQPVNLSMSVLKEVGAKWLVEMANYISANPQFIVNGFVCSGITGVLDRIEDTDTDDNQDDSMSDSASSNSWFDSEEETCEDDD